MERPPFVPVGRIVKTHGVKGELAVAPTADLPLESLAGVEVWLVPPPGTVRAARLDGVRTGPKGPLVKLEGVDDVAVARTLVGTALMVRSADLPPGSPSAEGPDPVGLKVTDTERGEIGTVTGSILTGANDVWIVGGGPFGEVLIPVIDDVVLDIDWDGKHVLVRLLPGLLSDED